MADDDATDAPPDAEERVARAAPPEGVRTAVRSPLLRDDRPLSLRWPWSRSVLGALLGALLPFAWAVETTECGAGTPRERTGADMLATLAAEPIEDTWVPLLAALLCLGAPWLAAALVREGPRLLVHVVGALASLGTTLLGIALVGFTVFEARTLRPAGYVVVALLVLVSVDAIARLVVGIKEWLDARRSGTPRAGT